VVGLPGQHPCYPSQLRPVCIPWAGRPFQAGRKSALAENGRFLEIVTTGDNLQKPGNSAAFWSFPRWGNQQK
jgi:hypothetical protein